MSSAWWAPIHKTALTVVSSDEGSRPDADGNDLVVKPAHSQGTVGKLGREGGVAL